MKLKMSIYTVVKISVIVPVYNAMPYLTELLDSLAAQTMDKSLYDVTLINDGSTDDGGQVLDRWVGENGNARVIHQENSGWPGGPRNRGLENTSSEYVFFADSDDILAPTALSEMVQYADDNGSDIVIPQMAGFAGRNVPKPKNPDSVLDIGLVDAFRTLGPIKLYRRRLLNENNIWFPEGRVRLEDGIFNAHAYVKANRVSILRGKDYYLVRSRDDGQNISVRPLSPEGYTNSISEICRIADQADVAQSDKEKVFLGIYQRKCLKIYLPQRFVRYTDKRRKKWVSEHRKFIREFISERMESRLAEPFRTISSLVRRGDIAQLLDANKTGSPPRLRAHLKSVSWSSEGIRVELEAAMDSGSLAPQLICEARRRDGRGVSAFPLRATAPVKSGFTSFLGVYPTISVAGLGRGTYDLHVALFLGKRLHLSSRLDMPVGIAPLRTGEGVSVYATRYGNASLRVAASDDASAAAYE